MMYLSYRYFRNVVFQATKHILKVSIVYNVFTANFGSFTLLSYLQHPQFYVTRFPKTFQAEHAVVPFQVGQMNYTQNHKHKHFQ